MRIPEHIVEQIIRQTDIVEVIGEAVQLRKRGQNYIGLCPFHNEKTPSFNVLPERGIFKCFGCGKGGNAAIFLREHQKITYPEALKELAKRAGIVLPDEGDRESREEYNRQDNAFAVLRAAGNFYYLQLLAESGSEAMRYLEKRGFTEEIIKLFGVGYSPDSFNATGAELKSQGYAEENLLDAGLSIKREEDGRVWDRFRGRLMFPIQNPTGRVIGFGARRMNDDKTQPKYINSPQSLVYDKSHVLYGLFQAKDALRRLEYAILVEGYADLISTYQAGFQNVVASSGTALTREQLRLLSRYCKRLHIVYDADNAGVNAALRGLDLAVEEGFDVAIVTLPEGDDPDSLIQRDGAEAFQRCLDKAQSLVNYKIEVFRKQGKLGTPAGQADAVRDVVETIAKVPDTFKRDFMIRDVALRFSLSEHDLYRELNQMLRRQQFQRIDQAGRERRVETNGIITGQESSLAVLVPATQAFVTQTVSEESAKQQAPEGRYADLLPEEQELLRIALTQAGAVGYIMQRLHISVESFITETAQQLFQMIADATEHHHEPLSWLMQQEALTERNGSLLAALAVREETPSERWRDYNVEMQEDLKTMLRDCMIKLHLRRYDEELRSLQEQLKHAQDHEEPMEHSLEILKQIKSADEERRRLQEVMMGAVV